MFQPVSCYSSQTGDDSFLQLYASKNTDGITENCRLIFRVLYLYLSVWLKSRFKESLEDMQTATDVHTMQIIFIHIGSYVKQTKKTCLNAFQF